jgi:hypothetical protein
VLKTTPHGSALKKNWFRASSHCSTTTAGPPHSMYLLLKSWIRFRRKSFLKCLNFGDPPPMPSKWPPVWWTESKFDSSNWACQGCHLYVRELEEWTLNCPG